MKRLIAAVVSTAIAVGVLGIAAAPSAVAGEITNSTGTSGNKAALAGNNVTFGGGLNEPAPGIFNKEVATPNPDPTHSEKDRSAPYRVDRSIAAGWVYQGGPWTVNAPPMNGFYYDLSFSSFDSLASMARCTSPVATPGRSLDDKSRTTVYAAYGWEHWAQDINYTYLTYEDSDGDGSFDTPIANDYYLTSNEVNWYSGCGGYSGPDVMKSKGTDGKMHEGVDCTQATEYYLNGPFDQNNELMRSENEGGTNKRVPYRKVQTGEIGHYSDKLQTMSDPMGEYLTKTPVSQQFPYGWDFNDLLTKATPAYVGVDKCLSLDKDQGQKAVDKTATESLTSAGRYNQPETIYYTHYSGYVFNDYISNMALVQYLYPNIYNKQREAGSTARTGFWGYGDVKPGSVAIYISDAELKTKGITIDYASFCNTSTNTLELAEVTNGWRGSNSFIYRNSEGVEEARNGRPASEGTSQDFYSSGACQGGGDDTADSRRPNQVRGDIDLLRCGDYATNLHMAYNYVAVPYQYNTKAYTFDTVPLPWVEEPAASRTLTATTVPRPTEDKWEVTGSHPETVPTGQKETYDTGQFSSRVVNKYIGSATEYCKGSDKRPPGCGKAGTEWRCPSGMTVGWTGCYADVTVWDVPIKAERDIMKTITVYDYGWVTYLKDCPAGTFLSGTICVVADVMPAVEVHTFTTVDVRCTTCTGGKRTETRETVAYAAPPAGYVLSGSSYVRVSDLVGTQSYCVNGNAYFTGTSCATPATPSGTGWQNMGTYWQRVSATPSGYRNNGTEWVSNVEQPPPAGYTRNAALGVYQRLDTSPAGQGWTDTGGGWSRVAASNILVQDPDGTWKPAAPIDNGVFLGNGGGRWIDDPQQADPAFQIWQAVATGEGNWIRWAMPKIEVSATGQDVNTLPAEADLRWRVKYDIDPASSPMYTNDPNRSNDAVYSVFYDGTPNDWSDTAGLDSRQWTPEAFGSGSLKFNAWSPVLQSTMMNATRAVSIRWYTSTLQDAQGWRITPWWEATTSITVMEDSPTFGGVLTSTGSFVPAESTGLREVTKRVSYQCPGQPFTANVSRTVTASMPG